MKNMWRKWRQDRIAAPLLGVGVALACSIVLAQNRRFMILDGLKYTPDQFELAMRSPVKVPAPRPNGGEYWVPRSLDGHFYVPGSINGMPVVWMVDTGASDSAIPMQLGRVAGIRVAEQVQFETAGGRSAGGISENNELMVGIFRLPGARVSLQPKLAVNLLGASALAKLSISYEGDMMILRSAR